jgi:2-polyprenyl-3-methyl-5-hydroxy-6-metoxy-1,4-benzoquinol methylase
MTPSARAASIGRAVHRYRHAGRFARRYVSAKLRRDPIYADLLAGADPFTGGWGHVVDIGCGRGQLAAVLLEAGLAQRVTGLDWNRAHLDQAAAALAGLEFKAVVCDLTTSLSVPEADTVTIIDVLYQLPTDIQHRLLDQAAAATRQRLLIRTLDATSGLRGVFAVLGERLARRLLPSGGAHVNPLPVTAIAARMADAGFTVAIRPSWRGTPFANVVLQGRRACTPP